MDIQKIITDLVAKLIGNKDLIAKFTANPLESVKELIGVDLDASQLETVVKGVTEKLGSAPADALKELDNDMMDSIEPFDFSKMQRFNPAYLAGFYTQRWNEDAALNEKRAKLRAKESMTREVMKHVGSFNAGTVIKNENYKWTRDQVHYAMLPVWMMYTEYKGKKYIFGMNGQTGKMMGEIPSDPARFFEIGGAVFIISQIVMLIMRVLGVM